MANSEASKRIGKLRAKLARNTATDAEKMEIAQWDAIPRRGRKPKLTLNSIPTTPTLPGGGNAHQPTPSEASTTSDSTHSPPISVHSNLPGMDGGGESHEPNLPPMSVDPSLGGTGDPTSSQGTNTGAPGAANPNPSSSTTTNPTPGHSASNASTNGKATVNPAEAAAAAKQVAEMATGALLQLNNWTVANGGTGMHPAFFIQWEQSFARLMQKYGGNMVQEDVDMFVVVGAGGFVGYNAWRTSQRLRKEGKDKNSVERHSTPPVQGPPPPVVKPESNAAPRLAQPITVVDVASHINPNGGRVY